jgi:hypothetical protein
MQVQDDQNYDDGSQPILPKGVLAHERNAVDSGSSAKKKKIIGGVVVGVAVLALVLGLTLRKSDPDVPDVPSPPPPIVPVNPYSLIGDLNTQTQVFTGVLKLNEEALKNMPSPKQNLRYGNSLNNVTLLDPRIIPTGDNNEVLSEITFEIGQSDFKTSYLILSDAKKTRYSIPESITSKPKYQ